VACEGNPSGENVPCAVCGAAPSAVEAGARDEREDFETAIEKHGRMRPFTRWPSDDSYTDDRIEWARRGWLAALARASEAVEYAIQVLSQVEAGDGVVVGQCADAIAGLESLAVTEAAAGETIYQCMCTDDDAGETRVRYLWMDVTKEDFESMSKRSDMRARVVYAAPQPARVSDDSAALLDWLIDNSATYTSRSVPLQLIAQEHHPIHQMHCADGYRKGLRSAIREAMQGIPQPASEQQAVTLALAAGADLDAIGAFYETPRKRSEADHDYRVRVQTIKRAFEDWMRAEHRQVRGEASPKDQAVYQSIADNYAKDLQGGEQQAARHRLITEIAREIEREGESDENKS
jgi:hypothetical protein